MIILDKETKIANETEAVCSVEASEAQGQRDEVNELKENCQRELDEALPILQSAQEAVKKIDKNQLNEMKSFTRPPELVGVVMNAVCLLFDKKV